MVNLGCCEDLQKTIAYSCCTFLPAECFHHSTLHPHNISSFYSNIVQYRFSHPTLCIYYSKIRQKDLTDVPYLPTHFIIFTYSHALTMFPPYTSHTLCFQKHQHLLQNNSLLWQMLPTKIVETMAADAIHFFPRGLPTYSPCFNNSFSRIACHPNKDKASTCSGFNIIRFLF